MSFCVFCLVGHWLELGYCLVMNALFGIVESDYAIWLDPWYHPYWVYGIGAVVMTLVIEPFKERIILRRKTLWGALLENFVLVVLIAMVLECGIGLIVNQPDAFGEYPYWDNSQLPFNILGQAWLVNDLFIGVASMFYVWILYPLICEGFIALKKRFSQRTANLVAAAIVIGFLALCALSYAQLITSGILVIG